MKTVSAWMDVVANIGVLAGIIFLIIEISQLTIATQRKRRLSLEDYTA